MSAGGILTDTMANLKYKVANPEAVMKSPKVQAKIAAAKKAAAEKKTSANTVVNPEATKSPLMFVRNLVKAYIKSPEKNVLKEWSDDNGGRKSPLPTGSSYIVYLNKGHPEGAKPGGFFNSQYSEGLHYAVSKDETRLIYPKKTDDWITDLVNAAKDADVFVKQPLSKIEEAIKSLGHFAWRWSRSDDTKKINYEVKSGETSFIVQLDNYPAYIEEFQPLKGYKIYYSNFSNEEGEIYMGGGNKPYLVVTTPTSSKERAEHWFEMKFGSDLVFKPDRTFRENIHYIKS
jgi:hypothetical protein